ncbi:glycoside hydrolase family 2 TIM barrel-domain containing protein [Hymenobacter endophyticus]|uniref:Glycoside hydrolase family 2 TIM barrel-domain containing protein n=1 Tax=Hymenobacter endophyticus TaxID=3076335 RepID=A0ABU3TCU6_9BACT|nr:glycoside hydrolase family 2 TIM barrel-domain containing protein [Hymenobacter endophyticus]MDU0369197.1 glycoside hydrolase family 2 TIM barrel-domain containing protein [Hymenobacter endophyticus]
MSGVVPAGVIPVRVVRTAKGFELQRNGRPYFVKGAAGLQHYDQLRAAGANSVRLWSADYADDRLNEAQRQGLTVLLGLWMEHESKQFDYYDKKQVAQQKERIRQQVLRYRHHPALLAWDIGNEVDLPVASPQIFRSMNDLAQMIHTLDPYHPVTTTLTSNINTFTRFRQQCPDLDFISINSFGELPALAGRLKDSNWPGPYMVTEFGARGYWESPKRRWGAAAEQSSTEKAAFTKERYQQAVLGNPGVCIGSYVFYWGNKFEYTNTWYSLFAPTGEKTATVDVMQELWSNRKPANLAPQITDLSFAYYLLNKGHNLLPETEYLAEVTADDPENDSLRFVWTLTPDRTLAEFAKELPEPIKTGMHNTGGGRAVVRTPAKPGAYRLTVSVFDGKGSVATANVPFFVQKTE